MIAAASGFISLLALGMTVWQGAHARKHARLSVQPILGWRSNRNVTDAGLELTLTLHNDGMGPALVMERYFTLDGKNFRSTDRRSDLQSLVDFLVHDDWGCRVISDGLPGIGSAILPGASIRIARLAFKPGVQDVPSFNQVMSRPGFVVVYQDLYNERHVFKVK